MLAWDNLGTPFVTSKYYELLFWLEINRKTKKSKVKGDYDREGNMEKTVVKFNSKIMHQDLRLGIHSAVCFVYRILISQMSNLWCFALDNMLILKSEVLFAR